MDEESNGIMNLLMPVPALPNKTPVSVLQEICSRQGLTPRYDLQQVEGVLHEPTFVYRVTVDSVTAIGQGTSKKNAKHRAAKQVLAKLAEAARSTATASATESSHTLAADNDGSSNNNNNNHHHRQRSTGDGGGMMGGGACADEPPEHAADTVAGNPVGRLQELCLLHRLPPPTYRLHEQIGQPHERTFHIVCAIGAQYHETGIGRTKRVAKRRASYQMLMKLKQMNLPSEAVDDPAAADDEGWSALMTNNVARGTASASSTGAGAAAVMVSTRQQLQLTKFHSHLRSNISHLLAKLTDMSLSDSESCDYVSLLEQVASVQSFDVTWIDIDEPAKSGERHCLVQLGTAPVAVCYGSGVDCRAARNCVARNALQYLRTVVALADPHRHTHAHTHTDEHTHTPTDSHTT